MIFKRILITLLVVQACAGVQLPALAEPSAIDLVQSLSLTELASTFSQTKVAACLSGHSVQGSVQLQQATALLRCLGIEATATDSQLPPSLAHVVDMGSPGWLERDHEQVAGFEKSLRHAMAQGLTTGYNVVPSKMWPKFDISRTVIYGHSDWKHARQLVALLITEGLTPKVVPLAKKSAFLYRDKWGEPTQELPRLSNGHRYIDQLEYDLFFEFASASDIEKFVALVNKYAKKDSADEEGLIYGSWWQPFYRTFVPRPNAYELSVMLVTSGDYRTNLMALPEQVFSRVPMLEAIDPNWEVETFSIWVNPGFYRNQLGDYR